MDQFEHYFNFFFKQLLLSPSFDGNVLNAYFNAIALARSYSFLLEYIKKHDDDNNT